MSNLTEPILRATDLAKTFDDGRLRLDVAARAAWRAPGVAGDPSVASRCRDVQ